MVSTKPAAAQIRIAYEPFQLRVLERGGVDEVNAKVLREQLPKV